MRHMTMVLTFGLSLGGLSFGTAVAAPLPGARTGCSLVVQAAFVEAGGAGPLCPHPLAMTLMRPQIRIHHT